MKTKLSVLLWLLVSNILFAYGGLMKGAKEIKYVKTDYFDIYYSEQSYEFAQLLVNKADSIYKEVCEGYKIRPERRFPVILACNTDYYNSYVNYAYYTHIVMFDSKVTPELSLYSDAQVLGVFRHELTHAIIWNNFLNDEMKYCQRMLGDHVTLNLIKITSMLNEGAAIASESTNDKEGRLNDGYYLHLIRQLKLLNSIPDWRDSMGNTSTFIDGGIAYDVGGTFTKFIQETYGIERFVEFISDCENSEKRLFISQSFKKVYEKTFDEVWNDFIESIEVPVVNANPLENEYVYDFFNFVDKKEKSSKFNIKNRTTSQFSSLQQSLDSVWYSDNETGKIYKAAKNTDGSLGKSKLITQSVLVTGGKVSCDGKYLALDCIKSTPDCLKYKAFVYDVESGKNLKLKATGVKDSVILKKGKDYYLACFAYKGQKSYIDFYKLLFGKNNKLVGYEFYKSIPIAKDEVVYSLTPADVDEGKLAVIVQKNLKWFIRIYDNFTYCDYTMPEDFRIRNLTYNPAEDIFNLTYVTKDTFPRFAMFDSKSSILNYMDEDLSGGVYSNTSFGNKLYYSANFVTDKKLLILDLDKVKTNDVLCSKEISDILKNDEFTKIQEQKENSVKEFLENLKPQAYALYNFTSFVPILAMNQYTADFGNFSAGGITETFNSINLGFTFLENDPWDNVSKTLSIGYNFQSDYVELSNYISIDNTMWGGNLSVQNSTNFIVQDWNENILHANNYFGISKTSIIDRNFYISLTDSNIAFVGKRMDFNSYGKLKLEDLNNYFYEMNQIGFGFGKIFTSPGYLGNNKYVLFSMNYQTAVQGTIGSVEGKNYFDLNEGEHEYFDFYQDLTPSVTLACNLLPITCIRNYSYNLPSHMNVSLYSDEWKFLSCSLDVILFEVEIQKALKHIPLYFHRIIVGFDYDCYFRCHNDDFEIKNTFSNFKHISDYDYVDSFGLNIALAFGSNVGELANSSYAVCPFIGVRYTNMNGASKNEPLENRKIAFTLGLRARF